MDAHQNGRITNINSGHVETRYVKAAETSAAAFSSQFCSKRDVQTTRPCAIIGPDRIIPQQAPSNVAWTQPHDDTAYYRFPPMPQYPEHFYPPRNISPRHTFQENMARIVVPPRHDPTVPPDIPNGYKMSTSVPKYSELPYTRQRYAYAPSHKTSEAPLHNVNIPPQQWNQVAVPPYNTNPYINQRIYRSASYKKPEAPPTFDPAYYSRFEPYTGKEKYPLQRYEYGYVGQPKYPEFPPSVINQPVQFPYPHPQYRTVAGRSYTVPYRNTFKYHIEDPTPAAPGKPYSYEVLDMNNRHFAQKHLPPYYGHTNSVPSRIPNPNIPYINKQIENPHYLRGYDPYDGRQNAYNPLARIPTEFSPNIISPSDSNTSLESSHSVPQHSNQEDCGYVSQCSTVSSKSIDYSRYNHPACANPPKLHKQTSNPIKQIDVRQFIQMWDEEFEESIPIAPTMKIPEPCANPSTNSGKNDQLYVLDLMTVPSNDLKRYEHVQKVSRLPDNIKGYDNLDLLKQFDEIVQTKPEVAYARPCGGLLKYNASNAIGPSGGPRPLSPLDVEAKISQSVIHKEVGCNFEIRPCSPVKSGIEIQVLPGAVETAVYPQITAVEQDDEHKMFNKKREKRKFKPKFEEPIPSNKFAKISNYVSPLVEKPVINHTEQYKAVPLASLPRLDCDDDITIPIATDMPNLRSALSEKLNPIDRDTATPPFDYNKLSKFRKMRNLNACSPALSSPIFPEIDYQSSSTDTVIRRESIDYHEIANNHPVKAIDFTEITNTHENTPFTHDFCTDSSGFNDIVDLSTVAKSALTVTDIPLKSYESTIDSYVQSSIEKFGSVEQLYDLNVLPENEIKNDFLDDITCDYIEEKSERSIVDSLLLSQINIKKVPTLSSLCLRFVNDCFWRVIEVPHEESNTIRELNNMSEILDLSCPTIHKSVLLPRVSPSYLQPSHSQKSVIVQNIPEFNETSNNSYNIDKKMDVCRASMDQRNNHSNSINRDSTFSIPLYDSVESYFHDINLDKNEYSYEDSKLTKCLTGEKMPPVDGNGKNEHIFNLLNDDDRILNHNNSHNFDTNEFHMEINSIDNKGGIVDKKNVGINKNVALLYADENNTEDCIPKSVGMILEASATGESPLPSSGSHEKGIDDFIKDSGPVTGISPDVKNIVLAGSYVENISHASPNMQNTAHISPNVENITHISLKLDNSTRYSPVVGNNACNRTDIENIIHTSLGVKNITCITSDMENITITSPDVENITIGPNMESITCESRDVENVTVSPNMERIFPGSTYVENTTHISPLVENVTHISSDVENKTNTNSDVENTTISPNIERITPESTDVENITHTSPLVENVTHISSDVENITNTRPDVENITISPNMESNTCNSRDVESVAVSPNTEIITPESTDVEIITHTSPLVINATHISSDVENTTNTSPDVENIAISPNMESITCDSGDVENVIVSPNIERITPESTDVENITHTSPLVENATHISSDVENIINASLDLENITISPNMESITCDSRDVDNITVRRNTERITSESTDVENITHTSPLVKIATLISSDVQNNSNNSPDVENIAISPNLESITCDSRDVENVTVSLNIESITADSTDVENTTHTSPLVENVTHISSDVDNITNTNSNVENITLTSLDVDKITYRSSDVENITHISSDVEYITDSSPGIENITYISPDVKYITHFSQNSENITCDSSDVKIITDTSSDVQNINTSSVVENFASTSSGAENVTLDSPYAETITRIGSGVKNNTAMDPDVENIHISPAVENNTHIAPSIENITRNSSDIEKVTHDARDFCNVETEMAQLFGDKTPNKSELNKLPENSVPEIDIEEYIDKQVECATPINIPQKGSDITADLLDTSEAETMLKTDKSTSCIYNKISSDTDDLETSISSNLEVAEPDNETVIFKCEQTAQELNIDANNVDSNEHTLKKHINNLEPPQNESLERDNVIIFTSPGDESSKSYPQDTISACSVITINRQAKDILESNRRDVISSTEVPIQLDIEKDDQSTPQQIELVSNPVRNKDTSYSETVEIKRIHHRLPQKVESVLSLVTNKATSQLETVEIENDDQSMLQKVNLVSDSIINKDISQHLETVKLQKDDKNTPQQVDLPNPVANNENATHLETVEKSLNVMYADEACGLEFDEVNETQIIVEDQDVDQDCVSQDEGIESTHSQSFESIDSEILLLQDDEHIGIIHIVENQVQFLQHQTVMVPSGMLNCADGGMLKSGLHLKRVSPPSYQGEETENIDDDTSNGESILLCTYLPDGSSENYTAMNLSKDICLRADNASPSPLEIPQSYSVGSPSYDNSSYEGSKIDHCWIDDVACVETVVSEEINGLNEDSECRIECDTHSVSDEDRDIQSNPDEFFDTVVSEEVNEDSECRLEWDTNVLKDNGDIQNNYDIVQSGEINKLNEDSECKIECNTHDDKEDNGDFQSNTDEFTANDNGQTDMHYDDIVDNEGKIHITKGDYQKCNGNKSTSKGKILFDINDINIAEENRANNEKDILAEKRNLGNIETRPADPSECNSVYQKDQTPEIKNEINDTPENEKMLRLSHNKKVLKRKRGISERPQNDKQSLKCGSIKTGNKLPKVDEPDPSNKRIKLKICKKDSGAMKQDNTYGVRKDCYKKYKNYGTLPNLEDLKPNNFATPSTRKKISLKIYQGRKNENKQDCLAKHLSESFIGNGIVSNCLGKVSKVDDTIENVPRKPLLTKAAQKYIPPISPDQLSFKVCLPLPKTSSILQNKSICSNISKTKIFTDRHSTTESCHNIKIKKKPKFDDVLKTIDDMQKCLAKTKSKKSKSRETIPKMIIKKNEYGAHYASTSTKKEKFNPDLSGNKWQPWVCLEKNNFIEKMVHRNKTTTLYYLALDRYRIVPTKNCVSASTVNSITVKLASNAVKEVITDISKPLKCTIKLKTNSIGTVSRKQELS